MVECQFDAAFYDWTGAPGEKTIVQKAAGKEGGYLYRCTRCGEWHWCVPSAEMRGSAGDEDAAVDAIGRCFSTERWIVIMPLAETWPQS